MRRAETYYKSTWDTVVIVLAALLAALLVLWTTHTAGAEPEVPKTEVIVSPWDGVFHDRANPGDQPFVEAGSVVTPETVVGVISLDIMRPDRQVEVFAGVEGTVTQMLVADHSFVDAGQPLMVIRVTPPETVPTSR